MKKWDYNINLEFDRDFHERCKLERFENIKNLLYNKIIFKGEYDCDVSEYAMEIYKEKYNFLSDGKIQIQYKNIQELRKKYNSKLYKFEMQVEVDKKMKSEGNVFERIISGDTLNSFATPWNHFVSKFLSEIKYKNGSEKFRCEDYKWLLEHFDHIFSEYNLNLVKYSEQIICEFNELAKLVHSVGNQFPVPLYFNGKRSSWGRYEFPDILLDAIRTYYIEGVDEKLRKIVKSGEQFDDYTLKWLNRFENWQAFIKEYHFKTYLDENNIPYVFWENHSLENTRLPEIDNRFVNYLKKINYFIKTRGKEISGEG